MGNIPFLSQAGTMFQQLLSGLQILALIVGGVAGVVVLLQMIWASSHGNYQARQACITHLEWIGVSCGGVFGFSALLNWVVAFYK